MFSRKGSLQRRLTLIFIVIVSLPLATAGYVVQRFVSGEIAQRALQKLRPALDANVQRYNDRVRSLPKLVEAAVADPHLAAAIRGGAHTKTNTLLRRALNGESQIDFLIVMNGGQVLAAAKQPPSFVDLGAPSLGRLARARAGPGYVDAQLPLRVVGRGRVATVVGGFWLDDDFLISSLTGSINMSVAYRGRIISSTKPLSGTVHVQPRYGDQVFAADIGGSAKARARRLPDTPMSLIASSPLAPLNSRSDRVFTSLLILLAVALLGTAAFAHLLARFITRPLEELTEGARAIAEGRFDHRIPVRSRDEVGELAASFNEMTSRLSETIGELQRSRNQLRQAIRRVGETLSSTHDVGQMLDSILNTASDAVAADAGAVWTVTPGHAELVPLTSRGLGQGAVGRVEAGEGIAGTVAATGRRILLPGETVVPAQGEPRYPALIAIPLYSQNKVMGVLAVYRKSAVTPFSPDDADTIGFLAEQAGVAIENVFLHEEARRMSLTDTLTGQYNRRYFEMQFRQTLATAVRFNRSFSVLMLDLDHFKRVNDTFGHPVGDAALVEFARRCRSVLREVDTFARYGGEEFICLLSETDRDGAVVTAEKIREAVRASSMHVEDATFDLTVSIGLASYPEHGDSFAALVDAADRALYQAKQEGRDRVRAPGSQPARPVT